MTEESTATRSTPWHLWVIGVLALLWNGMGAFDYVMTETQNEGYMSRFTPEQLDFFYGFPAWIVALWAIAVWGGVVAALLLLLRKRFAVETFLVALVAMVITTIRNYVFADGLAVTGGFALVFSIIIFVFSVLLYLYARAMRKKGVLT
jgi:hypothetical protein